MQRIIRDHARKYAFDWRDEPLLRVKLGESFEIETYDAGTGYFKTEADKAIPTKRPGFDRYPPMANPIGGPVFVETVNRGDVLVIVIEDILVGNQSWTAVGPKRGPFGESSRWPELSSEHTTKIFKHFPGPSGTIANGDIARIQIAAPRSLAVKAGGHFTVGSHANRSNKRCDGPLDPIAES